MSIPYENMSGPPFDRERLPPLLLFRLLPRETFFDLTVPLFVLFFFAFLLLFLPLRLLLLDLLPPRVLPLAPLPFEVCAATDGDLYFGVFLSMEA